MCTRCYKAHALCKHEDKDGTPMQPSLVMCAEKARGKACSGVVDQPITSANGGAAAFCGVCHAAVQTLLASIGALGDWNDDSFALYRRIKWDRAQTSELARIIYDLDQLVQTEMHAWRGPDHDHHLVFHRRAQLFEIFKAWILDQTGRDRISDEQVVPLLTRWIRREYRTVGQLIERKMDEFNPRDFKFLLQKAFIPWIQQWPLDFGQLQQGDTSWPAARMKFDNDWKQAKEQFFPSPRANRDNLYLDAFAILNS
ncbi:hypothetical protein F4861DRAFT_535229 [Xylaria intraflava]|nr:hypothetical protein F4861DRAFT_535229 [Xylaria intraflava]